MLTEACAILRQWEVPMTTILVVDDDPHIRSVVSRGLRFEG